MKLSNDERFHHAWTVNQRLIRPTNDTGLILALCGLSILICLWVLLVCAWVILSAWT